MAGFTGNAWQETALVSVATLASGTLGEVEFNAITETIDFDGFEKDFDLINLMNGGRLEKLTPEGAWSVTLEAYPLNAGTDAGTAGLGFWDLFSGDAIDVTIPVTIESSRARSRVRIIIMWSDVTSGNAAQQVVTPTNRALRFVGADAFVTAVKPSMSDGILKFTVTIKGSPFNSSGTTLYAWQSVSGSATATMISIVAYSSSATGVPT